MMVRSIRRFRRSAVPVVSLAIALLLALGAATPAYAFRFRVRGFGHGLGMSQYGAQGFALNGYKYDQILRHYYGNAGTDPKTTVAELTSEPKRDVLLDKAAGSGDGAYTKTTWTLRPGYAGSVLAVYQGSVVNFVDGFTTFTASGSNLVVTDSKGKTATYTGTVAVWGSGTSPSLTQVKEGTGQYSYEYVRFRGELRLEAKDGKVKLVNRVEMRDYLYGVVPRESPSWFEMEALKSQAVAARGYSYTSTRTELYTDTRDQVYGGHSRGVDRSNPTSHETSRTNEAVDATFGKVVMYDGVPVRTYFMSTSGGHTEDSENVWSSELAHIRGVPDPYEIYARSPYHSWTEYEYDAATVRTRLLSAGISSLSLPATIASIHVTKRGDSGRVMEVVVAGTDGSSFTFSGSTSMDRFRNALGLARDRWWYVDPHTANRIAGPDRYATSVAASQRIFTSPNYVILAGGDAPADALAASGLAGAAGGAPILLTESWQLTTCVADEIKRLSPTKVYIVGGTGVVSEDVIEDLHELPGLSAAGDVERLGGRDRYETAQLIAEEIKWWKGPELTRAIVVNGDTLVDAVAAAGLAYQKDMPIIPVKATAVPAYSAAALNSLDYVSTSLVVGGSGAVGDEVMQKLPGASRIAAGTNRYDTAVKLAEYVVANEGFNWGSVYVSSGVSIVDALAAAPVAGHNRNPMLFVMDWKVEQTTFDCLYAHRNALYRVHIVGGEGVIPGWQQGQIDALLE
ncbi:MAG: cell wall-binding repeat-containing protein [Coriobacteriia bacterium]|nr:cell wall-binding repeat-containing protein [Coriobacteriia bacterium]